ncbi:SAM-dependent methyltransferase [Elusimicrobium posterum]
MSMVDAKSLAQRMAFAPLTFQAIRAMLEFGILKIIDDAGKDGVTLEDIKAKCKQSHYTVTTLLEVAQTVEVIEAKDNLYFSTKTAQCFLYDTMTKVNMDFVQDVCYQGAFWLKESFETSSPAGLKVFGPWPTVYQGLSQLPKNVQQSWFNFDHFYSDNAFDDVIKIILSSGPKRVFDIGCNTGKFEIALFKSGYTGEMVMIDLPPQLEKAKANVTKNANVEQCTFCPVNVLDSEAKFPENPDIVLMSQFLDCFSLEEITSILKKVAAAATPKTRIFILEPFWDNQRFEAAKLSLVHTSLYFTCIANGNSKMYSRAEMENCVSEAGLSVARVHENVGNHEYTLLECSKG